MPVRGIEHIEPMPNQDTDKTTSNSSRTIRRRDVVKAVGASAVGGVAFAGTASAWEDFSVHFCGCGACVVKGEDVQGPYTMTVYKEGKNSGVEEVHQPAPADPNFLRFVQQGRGKILAITFDGTTWCNPNECAQKLISRLGISCDKTGEKGHCGPPNDGNG